MEMICVYLQALRISFCQRDEARASAFASLAVLGATECSGADSPYAEGMRPLIDNPAVALASISSTNTFKMVE